MIHRYIYIYIPLDGTERLLHGIRFRYGIRLTAPVRNRCGTEPLRRLMSASVTLTKRGGTFKLVLKKELLNRYLKGTFKSKVKNNFKHRNLQVISKSNFKDNFEIEI